MASLPTFPVEPIYIVHAIVCSHNRRVLGGLFVPQVARPLTYMAREKYEMFTVRDLSTTIRMSGQQHFTLVSAPTCEGN